uniref:Uncharacterized protein n=1 Tax=Rhizophora mucronata TaxID=61149 RepID=A0A2P2QPS6_RHIMU
MPLAILSRSSRDKGESFLCSVS